MATQPRVHWWCPRVTVPSCRTCGYAVKGLPSFICPECGSDLREVGIDTPGAAQEAIRRARLGAVAAGTAVRGAAGVVAQTVGGVARALGRVMLLRTPVRSHAVTVEVRPDGRVVIDPPLRLHDGRHDAVIVISLLDPDD